MSRTYNENGDQGDQPEMTVHVQGFQQVQTRRPGDQGTAAGRYHNNVYPEEHERRQRPQDLIDVSVVSSRSWNHGTQLGITQSLGQVVKTRSSPDEQGGTHGTRVVSHTFGGEEYPRTYDVTHHYGYGVGQCDVTL